MYCRKCGSKLAEDSRFCSKCGTAINVTDTKASTINKNAVKKRKYRPVAVVIGVCLAFLVVTAGVFIYNKVQTTNYLKLLAAGSRYIEDQEWEEAINAYEKASNIKPKEAPPYLRLADIYFEQGDTEKAQEILNEGYQKTKAGEIQKELSHFTSVESADDALARKDYEAAIDYLDAAINIRPCVAENYLHLAKAYVEEWNLHEASTTLKKGYEATGDNSLYAVSIWGPLSPVETAYYMTEYIPITRCEYLFSANGINSYVYAYGDPIAGASYICEDEKVKYITLLDYDEYSRIGMFPQQIQGLPVFDSVLTYFDLEYSADNEISAVTYDGITFVTLDYEEGNCISITAQADFGSTFSVGDKLFFSYNDKNHISNITYGDVSVDFSYEEDGSFHANIPYFSTTCHYDSAGLWTACSETGGVDDFEAISVNGRITAYQMDGVKATIEYDHNNIVSFEISRTLDVTIHNTIDFLYKKINGVDRLVKMKYTLPDGGNAELSLSYDNEGNVVRINNELDGYDMTLVYSGNRLESYTITGRDLTQSSYVLKYDDVGRYIGKNVVQ